LKRVLIAGKDSYIGSQLEARLDSARFQCDTLDMHGDAWQQYSFAGYDAVVLVAGIVHLQEGALEEELYDRVNHRLAEAVGQKARQEGVKQFVFFSSMSVYGMDVGRIHADTQPNPQSAYGRSKLAGEQALQALADERFRVAVLRPPMIYGPGCKGNYPRLSHLIQKLHVLPKAGNKRSMLYIATLCAFLDGLLQGGMGGLYFPQNSAYVSTDDLARAIMKAHRRFLWQPSGFGWLLRSLAGKGGTFGKVFGSLTYDQAMSLALKPGDQPSLEESIRDTEAAP